MTAYSRIYRKNNKYYLFWATPLINPTTKKQTKWHSLCSIEDGILNARIIADKIISYNKQDLEMGNMPKYITEYTHNILKKRSKKLPSDPEKLKLFLGRNKDLLSYSKVLGKAFYEFNVQEVLPKHIAMFLDSKEETPRMAQVYKSYLAGFFRNACRIGLCHTDPTEPIKVEIPPVRQVYLNDDDFLKIRNSLLYNENGREILTGKMALAFVDLCYLTAQRTTEIRLLKWSQINDGHIYFKPSKTENSSNAAVIIPITDEIQNVLNSIQNHYGKSCDYVIYTQRSKPYTSSGIRSAWIKACNRVNIENVTLKDLRAKAITDASKLGYALDQISITAAHTKPQTTLSYIKVKDTPISIINLKIPSNISKKAP